MVFIIFVSFGEKRPLILIYGFSLIAYSSGPTSREVPYKHIGWTDHKNKKGCGPK